MKRPAFVFGGMHPLVRKAFSLALQQQVRSFHSRSEFFGISRQFPLRLQMGICRLQLRRFGSVRIIGVVRGRVRKLIQSLQSSLGLQDVLHKGWDARLHRACVPALLQCA